MNQRVGWLACAVACSAFACRDLERFDTAEGESYCGSLGAAFIQEALIPDDAQPNLRMRLDLDVDNLTTTPGILWTDDSAAGLCAPAALFDGRPLRAIDPLFHDALSFVEFGDGREHNLFAWVDSTCEVGTMLAVVSLMKNDDVEIRLLKPGVATAEPVARQGFGLFVLRRQVGTCGF